MAWTSPKTWATNEPIRSTDFNTYISDNLDWLLTRPSALTRVDEASDYTIASTTFADVDSTDLALTVNIQSGEAEVGFFGVVTNNIGGGVAYTYFDVLVDGTRYGLNDGLTLATAHSSYGNMPVPTSFVVRIPGLSVGDHAFKLQWKNSSNTSTLYAGAGTANFDVHPQFWARDAG